MGWCPEGKADYAWHPKYDEDFRRFVGAIVREYGWPRGPVNGIKLWNEPWEGLSIARDGARDMVRYRELYRIMGEATRAAEQASGNRVLVGGCDSSSNTFDKLFPDGSGEFTPYFDFCSIHYQGLTAPSLYRQWIRPPRPRPGVDLEYRELDRQRRRHPRDGDRREPGGGLRPVDGVLLRLCVRQLRTPRAEPQGAGRSHDRRPVRGRPSCRSTPSRWRRRWARRRSSSVNREFDRLVYPEGLPYAFRFHGLDGNADDATVVIAGDLGSSFADYSRYAAVRPLSEVRGKRAAPQSLTRSNPARRSGRRRSGRPSGGCRFSGSVTTT